ncbi:MAG: AAA family ATPase [Eubacterium sp.]|nr:AAA family ATPase [Eubacterium sp.]
MESIGTALKKCKVICNRYEKFLPNMPEDELFYQFCDDVIRMAFLVAVSDGYVDAKEVDLISYTFGVRFDYNTLARSYGLDYISDESFMKQVPVSIKTISGLEKQGNPAPNCFLEDTRVLYGAMKQFGDDMLNCTGAKLRFSVMIQSYFINNILNYIFYMEEMDGFTNNQYEDALSYVKSKYSSGKVEMFSESEEQAEDSDVHIGGIHLKAQPKNTFDDSESGTDSSEQKTEVLSASGQSTVDNSVQDYSDRDARQQTLDLARGDMSLASNAVISKTSASTSVGTGSSHPLLGNSRPAVGDVIDMDTINEILNDVDSMIGLGNVKKEIHDMVNMILINEMRRRKGLKSPVMSRHLVFTGNPGTGKTTIARAIGQIYKTLGILERGHMIETDRSGMVAGYMGQTAEKVNEVVNRAMGGILFIDEAYSLVSDNEGDYGQEAINTLLKLMEDNRDNLVVIVAGYTNEMENFINSNPGLRSRFNRYIHFKDYSDDELLQIFKGYVNQQDYNLEEGSDDIILKAISKLRANEIDNFGNARSVRNYFENVITNQANRLMSDSGVSSEMDELMLIKCCDLDI